MVATACCFIRSLCFFPFTWLTMASHPYWKCQKTCSMSCTWLLIPTCRVTTRAYTCTCLFVTTHLDKYTFCHSLYSGQETKQILLSKKINLKASKLPRKTKHLIFSHLAASLNRRTLKLPPTSVVS